MEKKIVIFDIDGILADINHQTYHSRLVCKCCGGLTNKYHEDELLLLNYELYKHFHQRGYPIYIFTSRREKRRRDTVKWLRNHEIYYELLEMRKENDYRPAYLVKEEFLKKNFKENITSMIKAVFEDEMGCITMYRRYNLKVYDCRR